MLGCMSFSAAERRRLTDLFLELGPDAPTLCAGWRTKDLAAHLLVRETRPTAAAGLLLPPLSGRLEAAMDEVLGRPYGEIVREWGAGPPRRSPVRLLDGPMNTVEHFVHHEDARRGGGEVGPRDFSRVVEEQLHGALKFRAPRMLADSELPVVLFPTGLPRIVTADRRGVAVDGESVVRVSGSVGELLLWVHGRDVVDVEIEGEARAVRRSGL